MEGNNNPGPDPFDTKVKKEYRRLWKEFIRRNLRCRPENAKVAFFPGPQCLEWDEVYKPMGFSPKNCYGIERDAKSVEEIRSRNRKFNIVPTEAKDFFLYCADNRVSLDICNLDYTEYPQLKHFSDLTVLIANTIMKDHSLIGFTFLGQREQPEVQEHVEAMLRGLQSSKEMAGAVWHEFSKVFGELGLSRIEENIRHELDDQKILFDTLLQNRDSYINSMIEQILTGTPSTGEIIPLIKESPIYARAIEKQREQEKAANGIYCFDKREGLVEGRGSTDLSHAYGEAIISGWANIFTNFKINPQMVVFLYEHQRKPYFIDAREAYSYQSGSRMIVDFLALNRDQSFMNPIKDVLDLPFKDVLPELREAVKNRKFRKVFSRGMKKVSGMLDSKNENYELPEREMIECEDDYSEKPRRRSNGANRKELKEMVFAAIERGDADDAIMEEYNLGTMQLAGYKASYSRVNGRPERPGSEKKKPKKPNGNGFPERDERQIRYWIEKGMKATEVAEKLDGKYSWQKIASFGIHNRLYENGNGNGNGKKNGNGRIPLEDRELIEEFYVEGNSCSDIADLFDGRYTDEQVERYVRSGTVLKEAVRKRDNNTCQYPGCGRTAEEQEKESNHTLHVHHIEEIRDCPEREYDPMNMITLCVSCHAKTNTFQHGPSMKPVLEEKIREMYPNNSIKEDEESIAAN